MENWEAAEANFNLIVVQWDRSRRSWDAMPERTMLQCPKTARILRTQTSSGRTVFSGVRRPPFKIACSDRRAPD